VPKLLLRASRRFFVTVVPVRYFRRWAAGAPHWE
jgi:hypothetical protein